MSREQLIAKMIRACDPKALRQLIARYGYGHGRKIDADLLIEIYNSCGEEFIEDLGSLLHESHGGGSLDAATGEVKATKKSWEASDYINIVGTIFSSGTALMDSIKGNNVKIAEAEARGKEAEAMNANSSNPWPWIAGGVVVIIVIVVIVLARK